MLTSNVKCPVLNLSEISSVVLDMKDADEQTDRGITCFYAFISFTFFKESIKVQEL